MEEFLGILLTLAIIFGFMSALSNTDYDSFIRDCEQLNKDKFYTGETYQNWANITTPVINKNELKNFCQNKYSQNLEEETIK